jgi:hypothetical protein
MPGPGVRNIIKNIFDVDLHHDPIRVLVDEDSHAKNDGLLALGGQYSKLMGGISAFEGPPETIGPWND